MSGTRIGPPTPVLSVSTDGAPRPANQVSPEELGDALNDLARLLVHDSEATRLAKAQSQMEALMYSAKLAIARGDVQGLRGIASEASRISRDLGAAGMVSDHVGAIVSQGNQVCQLCEGGNGGAEPSDAPPPSTDLTA